uniref:Uncharacterized protein n=1 Tax=Romanomermis culicivorax TaxID=13658 RepID=A0A915HQ82_ROMCU
MRKRIDIKRAENIRTGRNYRQTDGIGKGKDSGRSRKWEKGTERKPNEKNEQERRFINAKRDIKTTIQTGHMMQ